MSRLTLICVFSTAACLSPVAVHAQQAAEANALLTGRVYDAESGFALSGVTISGAGEETRTDLAGAYRLRVPEGEHSVTYSRDGYISTVVSDVKVAGTEPVTLDARLAKASAVSGPDAGEEIITLDALEVSASVAQNSAAGLTALRQRADVAVDAVSPEMLAKFSAGDAAEALIRVPGVSVAGGEFAVIRGLSDRYANTSLNGLKLPSPDPEKQAVQLDLFPAGLLDTIVVSKTFMPDLWGDTSGGGVDLASKFIPDAQELSVSVGTSFNTNVLGKDIPYDGNSGSSDWIGRGADNRPGTPPPGGGPRPASPVVPETRTGRPGEKIGVTYGDRFQIGERTLGVTFAVAQETDVDAREGTRDSRSWRVTPGPIASRRLVSVSNENGSSEYQQSEYTGALSGLLGLGFELAPDHRLSFTGLYAQSGTSTVERQSQVGPPSANELVDADGDGTRDYTWFNDSIAYRERNLTVAQLQGEHLFNSLNGLRMDWSAQRADTYQDEPAFSEVGYGQVVNDPGAPGLTISGPAQVGDYFISGNNGVIRPLSQAWGKTDEQQDAARVDFTLPLDLLTERESQLKFGAAIERTDRSFDGRVETYSPSTLFFGPSAQPLFDNLLTGVGPKNL